MSVARKWALKILATAGIEENGPQPWDIQVHNPNLYWRILTQGSLGLGESYMDGWWDCEALDEFFARVLGSGLDYQVTGLNKIMVRGLSRLLNMQNRARSKQVARQHYDVGNDLYSKMLGQTMMYSCGYWRRAETLDEAQEAKLELIACKLELQPNTRILDIGCGWGGACRFFAERYGVEVTGVTLSGEQASLAREHCEGHAVQILQQDYRDLPSSETFDAIYSIGMFEHVGYKNYRTFMCKAHELLPSGGRFLLHTIGRNDTEVSTDPWINRYIFPHGMVPSIRQIGQSIEHLFVMEDWHAFGRDYDRTLMAWRTNFESAWESLRERYDERFFRMWRYYLSCCAGSFRARQNQLWQILLVKDGLKADPPVCR